MRLFTGESSHHPYISIAFKREGEVSAWCATDLDIFHFYSPDLWEKNAQVQSVYMPSLYWCLPHHSFPLFSLVLLFSHMLPPTLRTIHQPLPWHHAPSRSERYNLRSQPNVWPSWPFWQSCNITNLRFVPFPQRGNQRHMSHRIFQPIFSWGFPATHGSISKLVLFTCQWDFRCSVHK